MSPRNEFRRQNEFSQFSQKRKTISTLLKLRLLLDGVTGLIGLIFFVIGFFMSTLFISVFASQTPSEFPAFILFILIFPIAGLILLYFSAKKGVIKIKVVEHGQVTYGTFSHSESTNITINKQPVYNVFFNFSVNGNNYTAVNQTYQIKLINTQASEPLIYIPENPNQAVMLHGLPTQIQKMFSAELKSHSKKL